MPKLNGLEIHDVDDMRRAVEAQARGQGEWSDRDDYTEADGLSRALRDAQTHPHLLQAAGMALLELLDDADDRVRAIAAHAIAQTEGVADALAVMLDEEPMRFVADVPSGLPTRIARDLRGMLVESLALTTREDDEVALRYLRASALDGNVSCVLRLAELDAEWLIENAKRAVPEVAIQSVLRALDDDELRARLTRARLA